MNPFVQAILDLLAEVWNWSLDIWDTGNHWARWAIGMIVPWPILVVFAALLPTAVAYVVVPIVALLPILAIVFLLIAALDPLVLAVLAAFRSGRRILRTAGAVIGAELVFGLYLALLPTGNRRDLLPMLFLAAVAIPFLSLITGAWGKWLRRLAVLVLLLVTLLFFMPNIAPALAGRWWTQEARVGQDIRTNGVGAILPDVGASSGEWRNIQAVPDQERAVKLPYLHWFDLNPEAVVVVRNENGDEFLWKPDDTVFRHAGDCKEGEQVEGIRDIPKSILYLRACDNRIVRVGITVEPATMQAYQSTR